MNVADKTNIRRNSIIWVDLGNRKGHIQSGCRPCIVVSCDKANKHAPVYNVIPGTSKIDKNSLPVHFAIDKKDIEGFLKKHTIFLTEQICTVDEEQVISFAGRVTNEETIKQINRIIMKQLGLDGKLSG